MRALTSATPAAAGPNEGFDADYEEMLKMYLKMVKKNELPEEGRQVSSLCRVHLRFSLHPLKGI